MDKIELGKVAEYITEKISVDEVCIEDYISTENMLPNKGGICLASNKPATGKVTRYQKGDILTSNIRPYFKKIWLADRDGGCSNDVLVIRNKQGYLPYYIYYVLSEDKFFDYSTASAKGTKMPRGDKTAIMQYLVPEHTIDNQERIIEILKNIDEKIRVNSKLNANLEDMAMAIFQTNFSGYGDGGSLADVAEIVMGQSPKGDTYNENGDGTVFYQGRAEFTWRFPERRLFTTDPKRMAKENAVLMSVRAPVGDINIANEECCIGRGLAAISSKTGKQSFIIYLMKSLKAKLDVYNGEGTVFGSINKEALSKLPISNYNKEDIDQFDNLVSPIDKEIRLLSDENSRLVEIRDALLTKLMSGDIDLSNIKLDC